MLARKQIHFGTWRISFAQEIPARTGAASDQPKGQNGRNSKHRLTAALYLSWPTWITKKFLSLWLICVKQGRQRFHGSCVHFAGHFLASSWNFCRCHHIHTMELVTVIPEIFVKALNCRQLATAQSLACYHWKIQNKRHHQEKNTMEWWNMDTVDVHNSAQWLSYDPHIDRERSRLILCPASKQLPGIEHPLKLVDDDGGERTQLASLGQEDNADTAFGSMEDGGREGEKGLLAASSVVEVPNRKHLFLISLEDRCLITGLWFVMGLPICGVKHSSSQKGRPSR